MLPKILNTIGDVFTPAARAELEQVAKVTYLIPSQEELRETIREYDAALVGLGLTFNRAVLERAEKLRVIATATTGRDHIDLEAARECGIEVLSLRGEEEFLNTITGTAELAFGMLLDLARRVPWAFESVKRYEWDREQFRGHSLAGKTLGIVGLGRLGRMMAREAAGFGMRVIFFDPYVEETPRLFGETSGVEEESGILAQDAGRRETPDVEEKSRGERSSSGVAHRSCGSSDVEHSLVHHGAMKVDFVTILRESDAISTHVHLTPETENMFGDREFAEMKPNAYFINTSRGKIVDERALLAALEQGKIAGYAADVLADELSFETAGFSHHPLVEYAKTHENLLIVPHIGGMTVESRAATDVFIAQKLARFLRGRGR